MASLVENELYGFIVPQPVASFLPQPGVEPVTPVSAGGFVTLTTRKVHLHHIVEQIVRRFLEMNDGNVFWHHLSRSELGLKASE